MTTKFNAPATSSTHLESDVHDIKKIVDTGISISGGSLDISSISGSAIGQKTMAASLPVTIASNQSALPVTISGNQAVNVTQVNGVAISTGQSTVDSGCIRVSCALGASGIGAPVEISGFGGISTTPGQKAMALSFPVVLPSDQPTIPVSIGGNQAVNVTQINSVTPLMGSGVNGTGAQRVSIATDQGAITTQLPSSLGAKATAASLSVCLPSDQATLPVSLSGNQAVNVAQFNGVTPLMGSGVNGTGAQRVSIATDQGAITTQLPSSLGAKATTASLSVCLPSDQATLPVSLSGNQAVNIGQVNAGTTTAFNTGVVGSGTLRTTLATDVNVPINNVQIGGVALATGVGLTSTGCQRVQLTYDSNEKYNIARSYLTNKTVQIKSQFSVTSATTVYQPVGFTATNVANLADAGTIPVTLYLSFTADNATDRSREIRVVGYDDTGLYKQEIVTSNASNSATQVATSLTYLGIQDLFYVSPVAAATNIVQISDQNLAGGSVTRAMAQIPATAGIRKANINWIQIPAFYDAFLTELSICRTAGTLAHTLILRETSALTGATTAVGTTTGIEIMRWSISGNDYFKYDGLRIPSLNRVSHNQVAWFEVLGSGVDVAVVSIAATFVFIPS